MKRTLTCTGQGRQVRRFTLMPRAEANSFKLEPCEGEVENPEATKVREIQRLFVEE